VYREFYNLIEKPFSITPDPQFVHLSEHHRTAVESLLYGIYNRAGFMVVTGEIGTGKTTICRTLLERLDRNVKTAVIFNSLVTGRELLESILEDFGYPSKGKSRRELVETLNTFLVHQLSNGENAVLIIDEAQNLSIPALEQIRMLSNLETGKEKMLQIILLGQSEFDRMLKYPRLKQLNQRIAIRLRLVPFTREETESYIYQRLTLAGARGSITFSRSAFDKIYKFSKGVPRLINLLCDRALMGSFVEQSYYINKQIVKKAKSSLEGDNVKSPPFHLQAFLNRIVPLPVTLLVFLFVIFTLGILSSRTMQNYIGSSIQDTYSQIFNKGGSSVSKIAADGNFLKMEQLKNSQGVSQKDAR
jgi:general secretion pathway protein A